MSELSVSCPECGAEIEIAEQLAAPLVEAQRELIAQRAVAKAEKDWQQKLSRTQNELAEQSAKLESAERAELEARKAKTAAEEAQRKVELEVQRKVDEEKQRIADEAGQKARRELAATLEAAEKRNMEQAEKLREAEQAELAARKAKSEADEALRAAEVKVARRLDEERHKLRESTLAEADEAYRLKVAEKDKQLEGMCKQIEILKRKGNTGSQQLQGEVQEVDLLELLQNAFPNDTFERFRKGKPGADILHTVSGPGGMNCGSIIYEAKQTSSFQPTWLQKCRDDQRAAKADVAAIISTVLPQGTPHFDLIDGVWVSSKATAVPMVHAIRTGLIETAMAKQAMAGGNGKKELVYNYLNGQEFRQRVSAMVEAYASMKDTLEKEKRAFTSIWSAREKQLERLLQSTGGMYGDLQGIIGANLPTVEGLELSQIEGSPQAPQLENVSASAEGAEALEGVES